MVAWMGKTKKNQNYIDALELHWMLPYDNSLTQPIWGIRKNNVLKSLTPEYFKLLGIIAGKNIPDNIV